MADEHSWRRERAEQMRANFVGRGKDESSPKFKAALSVGIERRSVEERTRDPEPVKAPNRVHGVVGRASANDDVHPPLSSRPPLHTPMVGDAGPSTMGASQTGKTIEPQSSSEKSRPASSSAKRLGVMAAVVLSVGTGWLVLDYGAPDAVTLSTRDSAPAVAMKAEPSATLPTPVAETVESVKPLDADAVVRITRGNVEGAASGAAILKSRASRLQFADASPGGVIRSSRAKPDAPLAPLKAVKAIGTDSTRRRSGDPGLDCTRPHGATLSAICSDERLSRLDRRLAVRFAALDRKLDGETVRSIHHDQTIFLNDRQSCVDRECLTALYRKRLEDLDRIEP